MATETTEAVPSAAKSYLSWRVVDIVTASVIGVAAGIIFWAWGIAYNALSAPLDFLPGASALLGGGWLFAGVLGGLAGMRLIGLFIEDWRQLSLARRARGVADVGGFGAKLKRFLGQAFSLLVLSIRRGSKLATAMEAKGFGSNIPRTWARPSTLGRADVLLVAIAVVIGIAAISAGIAAGTWEFILEAS